VPGEIALYTSIPPGIRRPAPGGDVGPSYQSACLASWLAQGFKVYSVNARHEIPRLPPLEGVTVIPCDAAEVKLPLALMLKAMEAGTEPICGLINADILLSPRWRLGAAVAALIDDGLLISRRVDFALNGDCGFYGGGYDLMLARRDIWRRLPAAEYRFGEPWWDHGLPLAACFRGLPLTQLTSPAVAHLFHPPAFDDTGWRAYGGRMQRAVGDDARALPRAAAHLAAYGELIAEMQPAHQTDALLLLSALNLAVINGASRWAALPEGDAPHAAAQGVAMAGAAWAAVITGLDPPALQPPQATTPAAAAGGTAVRTASYRLGEVIDFSDEGASRKYLREGWAATEPGGVCTAAPRARLHLTLGAAPPSALRLRFAATPLLAPAHPELTLIVAVAGRGLAHFHTRHSPDGDPILRGEVMIGAPLVADGSVPVELIIEAPAAPCDPATADDRRRLGLKLHHLRLELWPETETA
jgi:hypothetical protein